MATPTGHRGKKKGFRWAAVAASVVVGVVAAIGGNAFATGSPSIASDQADYSPGATVTLTGAGWQGDDSVALVVNDSVGASWSWSDTVTPDSYGNFTDTLTLPSSFVASYSVTATGSPSGTVATTSFTDSSTAVAAAPSGVSFSLTYQGFTDSACTTAASGGPGTVQTTTVTAGTNFSLTSSNYFKLTAGSASAPSGATFSSWGASGDGSFTTLTSSNMICAAKAATGGNNNYVYTATYSTPQATALSAVSGSGTYGGTATLMATLKAGITPLSGESVSFKLNGSDVGSATTDGLGVARLNNVSLGGSVLSGGYAAGTYSNYVSASFAGDAPYEASGPTLGDLTVNKAHLTVTADDQTITWGDPAPSSSSLTATISGFVSPETLLTSGVTGTASCSLTTPVPTDAGTYTGEIFCTVGTLSATNYDFPAANFVAGTYTINQATTTLTYTGDTTHTLPSLSSTYPVVLTATLTPTACLSQGTIAYTLDGNPISNGDSVGEGVYAVTATFTGNANCADSTDTATLIVGVAGSKATGGGFVAGNVTNGAGRTNFGFVVDQVPKTTPAQYKGQFVLVSPLWRFKGTFGQAYGGTYIQTSTSGFASGTGNVYHWNGLMWEPATNGTGTPFTISFTDNGSGKKSAADTFGVNIAYDAAGNGYTDPFPNFSQTAIKGGNITVSSK